MPKAQTQFCSWMAGVVLSAALLGALALAPTAAWADADDQDRARAAMLSGSVRPLAELMAHVESMYEGTVIEVELEDDDSGQSVGVDGGPGLMYEIKLLTPQGNLVKLAFDALSLKLLTIDGHDSERARKATDTNDD
ncbi:MAG TPA: hypothetical protein VIN57_07205 [Magnetovibrio sp.]